MTWEDLVDPLAPLPKAWWFPALKGLRSPKERRTYHRFDLTEQPPVHVPDQTLSWLETEPEKTGSAINSDDAEQQLTVAALYNICGDLPVPETLRLFASREDLQRRVRSATSCYLDVGQFRVPTSVEGGFLVHLLSDQQWVLHWLLYLDAEGNEAVVTTTQPVGFDLSGDPEWADRPPPVVPIDGTSGLDLCASSFSEFLYRFWIENELFFALVDGRPFAPPLQAYAARLQNPSTHA